MRVVKELTQVALPTECESGASCQAVGKVDDSVGWYCTRHPGHDGPHVATYDMELDEGPVTMIGLAWLV